MRLRSILSAGVLLIAMTGAPDAPACEVYVSPDGAGSDWTLREANLDLGAPGQPRVACLRGGEYDTWIDPQHSGSASDPVVFTAAPGEAPVIREPTNGASADPVSVCVRMVDRSWVTVRGITCDADRVTSPAGPWRIERGFNLSNLSHVLIEDNTVRYARGRGIRLRDSQFCTIRGNRVVRSGYRPDGPGAEGIELFNADDNVVEENVVRFASHNGIELTDSSRNLVRNNHVWNPWHRNVAVVSSDPGKGRNVVESNLVAAGSTDPAVLASGSLSSDALRVSTVENIVRSNRVHDNESIGIYVQTGNNWPDVSRNRVYGNVVVDNAAPGIIVRQKHASDVNRDNAALNNIVHRNSDPGTDDVQIAFDRGGNGAEDNRFLHNAILAGVAGDDVVDVDGTLQTLAAFEAANPLSFGSNEDPAAFVDDPRRNFRLAADSPQRDAGIFLAVTTQACSGSQITVDDAGSFFAGIHDPTEGVDLAEGDRIQLEGRSETHQVLDVVDNPSPQSDVITVDGSVTCVAGTGISLPYEGPRPDVGTSDRYVIQVELPVDATEDGYVIEDPQAPGTGWIADSTSSDLVVGDWVFGNLSIRSVLSFPTAPIPAGVEILAAQLELSETDVFGDPSELGDLQLELRAGHFGNAPGLEADDFEAPADTRPVGFEAPVSGTVWLAELATAGVGSPAPDALSLLEATDRIQVRLRHEVASTPDDESDQLWLASGEAASAIQPRLLVTYAAPVQEFASIDAEDGVVVESSAGSGVGGSFWTDELGTPPSLWVGDGGGNVQTVSIASFDTSTLPVGATPVAAVLELRRGFDWGPPGLQLGDLLVDVRSGAFGSSSALAAEDFEAAATGSGIVMERHGEQTGDVWRVALDPSHVNPAGRTQVRLRFQIPTDGEGDLDLAGFTSGADPSDHPRLRVYYQP